MEPKAQQLGTIVLTITLVGLGIFGIGAAIFWPPGNTLSALVLELSRRHPILPLAAGIVLGHLLWPQ